MASETLEIFRLSSWSFFPKYTKFHVDFQNGLKITEIIFPFWDMCLWCRCGNFCQLWGEYMLSAVNVLTVLRISIWFSGMFSASIYLGLIKNLEKSTSIHADLGSVSDPWMQSLPKFVLKELLFEIQVRTFFGVNKFGNI